MIATDEQRAAVDAALETCRAGEALKIIAGPGTGKTATLRMIATALLDDQGANHRILYLAYNRALKDEAKEKFSKAADVHTLHSLAFKGLKLWKQDRAIGRKLTTRHAADLLGLASSRDPRSKRALQTLAVFTISDAAKISLDHSPEWLRRKSLVEAEQSVIDATDLFAATRADAKARGLPLPHDLYLKSWDVLGSPGLDWYDTVLFDEAQDASPVIVRALSKVRHTISVGDENQQIYGWRGAVDAMTQITGTTKALTLSFRFGPAIAEAANRVLAAKRPAVSYRIRGHQSIDSQIRRLDVRRRHTRLYRMNESAIADMIFLEDIDRKPAIVGGTESLASLLEATWHIYSGSSGGATHSRLQFYENWQSLKDACENKASVDSDVRQAVSMIDKFGDRVPEVVDILGRARSEQDGLTLISTAHKAKGREWDQVLVAADFDESLEADDGQIDNEQLNLAYVATTRARHRLEIQSDLLNDIVEEG